MGDEHGKEAKLGEHTYLVRPQRHAYLRRRLSGFVDSLSDMQDMTDTGDVLDLFQGRIYELLQVFIPDLMERWEFEGYASESAMQADDYDEEADRSPDVPQLTDAFRVIAVVNDFSWMGALKNFLGPDLIRAQIRSYLATQAIQRTPSSKTSPSSPPMNGGSDQTSSGVVDPITQELPTSASPTDGS